MNAISEASLHAILGDFSDPSAVARGISERIAVAAAVKVLQVQREMGTEIVALLDPDVGSRLDRRA